ncbi:hypothetical protein FRZ00_21515 [Streptomyces mobaraensis]|uniref:Uncharacterized protein n=1 Tax=Streptomyces mobaraensis TaxID=35621 RepID=A0A5N5W486_STRMB|nr:hypothetical protein FRZ00_21515 [Streptomyces mobaraensis]
MPPRAVRGVVQQRRTGRAGRLACTSCRACPQAGCQGRGRRWTGRRPAPGADGRPSGVRSGRAVRRPPVRREATWPAPRRRGRRTRAWSSWLSYLARRCLGSESGTGRAELVQVGESLGLDIRAGAQRHVRFAKSVTRRARTVRTDGRVAPRLLICPKPMKGIAVFGGAGPFPFVIHAVYTFLLLRFSPSPRVECGG